jgi:sporulation protein YlmC with PRC-barrel domain
MKRTLPAAAGILALAASGVLSGLPVPPAAGQTPALPAPAQSGSPERVPDEAPLQTAPRPEDRATTDPLPVTPGAGGDAPSREMTDMGDPVRPGTPDASASPDDAPADRTGAGARQNLDAGTALPAVPPAPAMEREDAERMLGRPVINADGREIGTVRDFVLTRRGDGIGHVVVALAQPGGGERLVAIPAGHVVRTGEALELDIGAADLAEVFPFGYGPGTDALIGPDP